MTRGFRYAAPPARPVLRLLPAPLAAALLLAPAGPLPALELDYRIGGYFQHSDNVNLSASNPVSENVLAPTLRFTATQAGSRVKLSADGALEYLDYVNDTFQDEFRGGFAGHLEWAILPSRLNFVVQDYLSQQSIRDTDPLTPTNIQHVNLFLAGPSLYARFSPATFGQLDLRYGQTYAEEALEFRGDRYNAAMRVRHMFSDTAEVTGNVEATRVRYDAAGAQANYDREDGFVNYTLRRDAVEVDVDGGYSRVRRLAASERHTSPLVRATLTRRFSSRSRLRLQTRYQFADTTQQLITPSTDFGLRRFGDIRFTDGRVDPNIFRERSARLSFEVDGEATDVRMYAYHMRNDYLEERAEDQRYNGGGIEMEHRIRPHVTLLLGASHVRRDLTRLMREDRETSVGIGLTRRFTRHWTGGVEVRRRERDSVGGGEDFIENSAGVSLTYRR